LTEVDRIGGIALNISLLDLRSLMPVDGATLQSRSSCAKPICCLQAAPKGDGAPTARLGALRDKDAVELWGAGRLVYVRPTPTTRETAEQLEEGQ
jgi:hypothetical protein